MTSARDRIDNSLFIPPHAHRYAKTTERHYARAMQEQAHDRVRRDVQIKRGGSLPERLDALWEAWVEAFPNVVPRLGMDWGNVTEIESRRKLN